MARHGQRKATSKRSAAIPRKLTENQPSASSLPWLQDYFICHFRALLSSLGRLLHNPGSSLMTSAVIGIALAFPCGLYVTLSNVQNVTGGWDGVAQISLFTKLSISDAQAESLADRLSLMQEIGSIQTLTRKEALDEFQQFSGFGEALDVLDENPLPPVLLIKPVLDHSTPQLIELLLNKLRSLPETDIAQLDLQWVQRLYSIMKIGQRGILIIAALLALAVLLIVGNTIRLDIQNRKDEIIIVKLIGGTNAFIRRPFLYSGIWYGATGGAIAWLLIEISLGMLAGPAHSLAGLYGSDYSLESLNMATSGILFISSAFLGLVGSWLAVGRHLGDIEPA